MPSAYLENTGVANFDEISQAKMKIFEQNITLGVAISQQGWQEVLI